MPCMGDKPVQTSSPAKAFKGWHELKHPVWKTDIGKYLRLVLDFVFNAAAQLGMR